MSFSLRRSSDDDRNRHRDGYTAGKATYKKILNTGSLITSAAVLGGFALIKDKVPYDQVVKVADHMVKENGLDKKGFKYHFIDKEIDENLINMTAKGFR